MDYYVYTDGSYAKERQAGAYAVLIISATMFIAKEQMNSSGIRNCTHAECLAISRGAELIQELCELTPDDKVIICTDSLLAIKNMTAWLEGTKAIPKDRLIQHQVKNVKALSEVCQLQFRKANANKKQ